MAENKTVPTAESVDAFIDALDDERRRADARALAALMAEVTGEPATMWGPSIIGFGAYHYVYDTGREGDMPLVGFSPRKANLVLYIMPGFAGYDELLGRLGKLKMGKACLYLKRLSDVDAAALRELVAASAAHMKEKWG